MKIRHMRMIFPIKNDRSFKILPFLHHSSPFHGEMLDLLKKNSVFGGNFAAKTEDQTTSWGICAITLELGGRSLRAEVKYMQIYAKQITILYHVYAHEHIIKLGS